MPTDPELATFAGGCFWCTEAAFKEVPGVQSVTAGYAGGDVPDPSYEEVSTGETGHAECVQIEYDPDTVSYVDLLGVFFRVHDPTQLNRQGPDVGSQYRSAIFAHDTTQRETAAEFIEILLAEDAYDEEIVTEIEDLDAFYPAEAYHQDYYEENPEDRYCTLYVEPKVKKVQAAFSEE
ncbi:peptide-methionine (S)-S-oxide reductase MsrA [Halodesulfurarchaeum formicicum]|uniref:Peptide methionine sulfoxide reductase MsrA n=1 Tax=Halodesulfurarchaeum formicicum TaxID=1873524 RepID=A0A1J1AE28_9EURY|nr:peptide-methionine (S)-S-oxide reductase MsrA [Halodesulfurarchaeum formicicum]APE96157.1 peptide-methionine (S)-S-oxide reductase [Halodesulfurarchaeum formicicum]